MIVDPLGEFGLGGMSISISIGASIGAGVGSAIGFQRTGTIFSWETGIGMTVGALGAVIGIVGGGTVGYGIAGGVIATGAGSLTPYVYLNMGENVGLPYRTFNFRLPQNFLFDWFFFGSSYGALESVWDQYKVNLAYALTSSSKTNPQNKENIENKIARIYVDTVKMNAGRGTGGWTQSILYKFNYWGASFAPNCNFYARKVAYDLAQQLHLESETDWKVELVLNSSKYGSSMPQAGLHSFVVLSYKGHREWVLDPWQNNLLSYGQ